MIEPGRRNFIRYAGAIAAGFLSGITRAAPSEIKALLVPTPSETEGPFYPVMAQKDLDFDLTRVEGGDGVAQGKQIFIAGRVLDTAGNAIEDATVDLWQANAAGRYRHPEESDENPLDPNFQGWAIVPSGNNGAFRFKTIYPGAYGAGRGWRRPPHIHFKISKPGYKALTTQLYFPGEALNEKDFLYRDQSEAEQKMLTATASAAEPDTYTWDIVLQKT
jgi:protocatechuate 3,4-dioxygenase beta subunit